jgi:outer membrane receptor protein involved in Fe transport
MALTACAVAMMMIGDWTLAQTQTAQQSPSHPNSEDPNGRIEEIVVTAQRRTENLQDVPISVQVVNQETLIEHNLTDVQALSETQASFHVVASGRASNYYIRGTGSGESQSFDQSVGTFVDDIYHGRSRNSALTFLDLDHVEILKGPQSTFFGNNAIAGAINIVTQKPTDTFSGFFRGLIGPIMGESDRPYAAEAGVNVPLRDDLSVRLAGIVSGERGYLTNGTTGKQVPDTSNYAFRATLRYKPIDRLEITLKGEFGRDRDDGGIIVRQTFCPPPVRFGPPSGFCAINLAAGAPIGLDGDKYSANGGNQTVFSSNEAVLTANYQFNGGTLTSVTGYTDYQFGEEFDADATALQLLNVQAPEKYHQFSQELRFASTSGKPIEFLGGLYFQSDPLQIRQSINFFFLTPALSSVPPFAPLVPYFPLGQEVNAVVNERNYSAFASVTWNISDKLKLSGGLRGSIVTKDFDWNLFYGTATAPYGGITAIPSALSPLADAIGLGNAGSVALSRRDKALLPSAQLKYQFTPDVMTYLSYSRGFKSGGFSVAELSADPANYAYNPEYVKAYEFGMKSELLDRHLLLNLAVFRNDFSDLQVTINGNNSAGAFVNIVRNAAASRAQGVELETQWVVSPEFRISANASYLDSKYVRYPNASPTYDQQLAGQTTQDLSGSPTLYAPTWSGNVTGTLNVPIYRDYRLTLEATGIFSTTYYTTFTVDPLSAQKSYERLDARVAFDSPDRRWGVDLIGKNLTNTVIRTLFGYEATSFGSAFQDREQLRNVALQFRYRF